MRSNIKFFVRAKRGYDSDDSLNRFFKPYYKTVSNKKSDAYLWSRSALVTEQFVGKRVSIHNGRGFSSIVVRPTMLGRRFGEFALSKRRAVYTKTSKPSSAKKKLSK
jgi:small subunit ribosomal protein S19